VPTRPRLLYVVTLAEVGGAQSYVRGLLPAVREQYDVAVAAHGDGPLRDAASELGVPFVPLRHVRRALSPVHDPLGLLELARLFRRLQPDIVHLNSSKAGVLGRLAAALARVPVRIFTAHGWAFKATSGTPARLYLVADRVVRPMTTMVVCVSQTELDAGVAARVCTPKRTRVIPNAVDVSVSPPVRAHAERPLEIVSVGRLAEPKDFATLVAALARLPRGAAHLSIVGDGPLRAVVEADVARLGLRAEVTFTGEVADARPYLDRAAVFALASMSEGMPLSVLEAMAAGLPVVASDVGGIHEVVVEGETGFLVAPADPRAFAERLAQLVAEPALVATLGIAGRARAEERFSLPAWRDAHLELYRTLLEAHAGESSID
jgi:glycosyltransferase involved in cell wall biosynthesis